jgi:hypothetical protein
VNGLAPFQPRAIIEKEHEMFDNDYVFTVYFEPVPSEADWYKGILKQFWQHGLLFQGNIDRTQNEKSIQWDTVLQLPIAVYHTPLQQWLIEAATKGRGTIIAYDRNLAIFITLQAGSQKAIGFEDKPLQRPNLGKIEIRVAAHYFSDKVSDHKWKLIPGYTQSWIAWVHWAELCCRMINPLYGCGYGRLDTKIKDFPLDGTETQYIELPLLNQRLPKTEQIFGTTLLQYLGPQFVEQEEAKALMRQHTMWTHYLPTGGALLVHPEEKFSYGHGLAYDFLHLAATIDEHDEKKGALFRDYGRMILQQTRDDIEE